MYRKIRSDLNEFEIIYKPYFLSEFSRSNIDKLL